MNNMLCGARVLSLVSLTFGLVASGALSLAVATDFWLFTDEPVVPPAENETDPGPGAGSGITLPPVDQLVPINIRMHSGLWRLCIINEPEDGLPPEVCYSIDFDQSSERFEEADTSNSIIRSIRKTAPLFIGSLLLLLTALFLSILGTTKNDCRTIIGAVVYVFSALCLAMGVIMYISAVNDEVAHRKKTETSARAFSYRYGWAFFFGAATFICAMVAAVSNISLYLLRYSSLEDSKAVALTAHAMDTKGGYRPVAEVGGCGLLRAFPGHEIAS